jgi:hypothetical protein
MVTNGHRWTEGAKHTKLVRQTNGRSWTLDGMATDVKQNGDERWTKRRNGTKQNGMERTTTVMDCNDNYTAEWSTSVSFATMVCKRKERKKFFLLRVFVYFLLYFLLPKLLQGLFTTWLQAQKRTRVHNPNANFKTHVQGNEVYLGLHHVVQILNYNQTLCVCVCASS